MKIQLNASRLTRFISRFSRKNASAAPQQATDSFAAKRHPAAEHAKVCAAAAGTRPTLVAPNLSLPPRTHGEYVMRFEHLSAAQRIWCKVNLPATGVTKATFDQVREYKGAPYPSKNTLQIKPALRVTTAPQTVAEYRANVQAMTFSQLHWCFWNVPGMVTPKHLASERVHYEGFPFPLY